MLKSRVFFFAAIVVVAVLGASSNCLAQIVPFRSTGEDNLYVPADFGFGGEGTTLHLGKSSGDGVAIPIPTDDDLVLNWIGAGSFQAANGDKIFFDGGGQVFLVPLGDGWFTASWLGEFHITGGDGRFINVGPGTAPLSVVAINQPFRFEDPVWYYDYEISGDMDLGKNRND